MTVKLKRREAGSYITTINGERYVVVNMKSGGPNEPRWQGPIPSWEIRKGGQGDHDIGASTLETVWSLAEARSVLDKLAGQQQ